MKRKKLLLLSALLLCSVAVHAETSAHEHDLLVRGVMRFSGTPTAWEAQNATVVPTLAGSLSERMVSKDNVGQTVFVLSEANAGGVISQETSDYHLGDYITDFSFVDDVEKIDWAKTLDGIEASANGKNGYITVFRTEERTRAVLFTHHGIFNVQWHLTDGTTFDESYRVGLNTAKRPYRLFWTEKPYSAPRIGLSGRHIKLFGRKELVEAEIEERKIVEGSDEVIKTVVNGVYFDETTETLAAYAKSFDEGPRGQFVLAYYQDAQDEVPVHTITVQVGPPDSQTLKAEVGDELRPQGGAYDVKNLTPSITAGLDDGNSDPYLPYVEQFAVAEEYGYSEQNGAVFAVTPTDGSTDGGDPTPWKIDIYWQQPDPMDTMWPFEENWYLVSWPTNLPVMVVGNGTTGPGASFDGDMWQAALCNYHEPFTKEVATVSATAYENKVIGHAAGRFTVKLTSKDMLSVHYLPMRTVQNDDTSVFDLSVARWYIGEEVLPRGGAAAGKSRDLATLVDDTLPGYIFDHPNGIEDYNVDLYHPTSYYLKNQTESAEEQDPYKSLTSSIFFVNEPTPSHKDDYLEVWWYRTYQKEGMTSPLIFPSLPQRYAAEWPKVDMTRDIVLASGLGSNCESPAAIGGALYFAETNATGETTVRFPEAGTATTLGFAFKLSPEEAEAEFTHSDGAVLSLALTNAETFVVNLTTNGTPKLVFDWLDSSGASKLSTSAAYELTTNDWQFVCLTTATGGAPVKVVCYSSEAGTATEVASLAGAGFATSATVTFGAREGTHAATDLAIDNLLVLEKDVGLDGVEIRKLLYRASNSLKQERYLFSASFDGARDLSAQLESTSRFASDSVGGTSLRFENVLSMAPGVSSYVSGLVPVVDGIAPRVYYNNTPGTVGFNPNEEHAFVKTAGESGATVWALRCDLNTGDPENSSEPFVFVNYNNHGKGGMMIFNVALVNDVYTSFGKTATAGLRVPIPDPIGQLENAANVKNYAQATGASVGGDGLPLYRDKNHAFWARRDGTADMCFYYPMQDGFYCPSLSEQLATGTLVGWMNCWEADGSHRTANPDANTLQTAQPYPWSVSVTWPAEDSVPTMRLGQTLTKATGGLSEVWNASSIGITYPSTALGGAGVVSVIDPVVAQTAALSIVKDFPSEYGFTLGSSGTCQIKKGKYYLRGLPPSISDRFYIDVNQPKGKEMVLIGRLNEPAAGTPYLQMNVLSAAERAALKAACVLPVKTASKVAWDLAIDTLATNSVMPSIQAAISVTGITQNVSLPIISYSPVENYAVVANGTGSGWVTMIENDSPDKSMVAEGTPVNMHIFRVVPELYTGKILALEDPMNKLSEQLNILYAEPFGKDAENFEFQWVYQTPPADGSVPTNYPSWNQKAQGFGLTGILLGGSGMSLKELVNTYYTMRYRAKAGTPAHTLTGGKWSDWCTATLAEGWVQRVLKNVTPFAQRILDFYEMPADLAYTMPQQIGRPYEGDVALNNDNLANVGLLELYQTVLNKAESMSLAIGVKDTDVNKQLMEAASRLADLYILLGDDAYSDAQNPTIDAGYSEETNKQFPAGVFSFQNQLPSLLDEELALLRGRSRAVAPSTQNAPYYNRLMWNFTTGITEGEMAYVQNYNIQGSEGEITAEQAATQYPMGHGDAYGHYLSSVWGYYRLLRNPNFAWGDPSMMEMLVAQSVVNMDYEDEQKFALAAAKLAKTGAEVVNLTARKTWKDQAGETTAGYFDGDTEQAFGYGEWATRTGLGAIYNWAVVNSLLPTNAEQSVSYFEDQSIAKITRENVSALGVLAKTVENVQRTVNSLDSGVNPVGLSDNAIPFDIDPAELAKHNSHFEQIFARTEKALDNATKVLENAAQYGGRMRALMQQQADDAEAFAATENAFTKELIAIYGTPYPDDIGPTGTYAQGYEGPDIYHYNYMDLSLYDAAIMNFARSEPTNVTFVLQGTASSGMSVLSTGYAVVTNFTTGSSSKKTVVTTNYTTVVTNNYSLLPGGILAKPKSWTSHRRTEGSVQTAYRNFLAAYNKAYLSNEAVKKSAKSLDKKLKEVNHSISLERKKYAKKMLSLALEEAQGVENWLSEIISITAKAAGDWASEVGDAVVASTPKIIGAGLTVNVDPSAVAAATEGLASKTAKFLASKIVAKAEAATAYTEFIVNTVETSWDIADAKAAFAETMAKHTKTMEDAVSAANAKLETLTSDLIALSDAEALYRKEVARGEDLLAEREMVRQEQANKATRKRYADMFYRVQYNNALSRYRVAYDLAQKYVFELAKVYDYETGLITQGGEEGNTYLGKIIASRALGTKGIVSPDDGSDPGLWSMVEEMSQNWDVLKGRYGINNPDTTTKWFSLRYSLFRIGLDASGDAAWKRELEKYWVDDIFSNSEVKRYCQEPVSASGVLSAEPGLVIPFSTAINVAENFFGRSLLGGETTYSSSDYATKIHAVGVEFAGYDTAALAHNPNIYLVPVGRDIMRSPNDDTRQAYGIRVIDQVLPIPYTIGAEDLANTAWMPTSQGLDGTADSCVRIRRHSTLVEGATISNTRLVGRSVWNDRWLLVIPASSLHSDRVKGLKQFIKSVDDIRLGIQAYSRSGN